MQYVPAIGWARPWLTCRWVSWLSPACWPIQPTCSNSLPAYQCGSKCKASKDPDPSTLDATSSFLKVSCVVCCASYVLCSLCLMSYVLCSLSYVLCSVSHVLCLMLAYRQTMITTQYGVAVQRKVDRHTDQVIRIKAYRSCHTNKKLKFDGPTHQVVRFKSHRSCHKKLKVDGHTHPVVRIKWYGSSHTCMYVIYVITCTNHNINHNVYMYTW